MRCSNDARPEPPPIAGVELVPMERGHLDEVLRIELESFATPWRREHFLFEIDENRFAVNRVARRADEVLGYASTWFLDDEMKINNIAVRRDCRGAGLGSWMLGRLLADARGAGCKVARLEVRPSNGPAMRLYARYGFVEVGRRRGYYRKEGEDAVVMELGLC